MSRTPQRCDLADMLVVQCKLGEIGLLGDIGKGIDDVGNRLTMEDGRGNVTTYVFNVRNLVTPEIEHCGIAQGEYVEGLVTQYTYYANGLLETTENKNGTTITNTYDVHGRKLSQTAGAVSIGYTYDVDTLQFCRQC